MRGSNSYVERIVCRDCKKVLFMHLHEATNTEQLMRCTNTRNRMTVVDLTDDRKELRGNLNDLTQKDSLNDYCAAAAEKEHEAESSVIQKVHYEEQQQKESHKSKARATPKAQATPTIYDMEKDDASSLGSSVSSRGRSRSSNRSESSYLDVGRANRGKDHEIQVRISTGKKDCGLQ